MKFHIETVTGDLILIKTNIPTPPPCPVIARSASHSAPWFIRLVLLLAVLIAPSIPHWPVQVWIANKARVAVLVIVAVALVEVLAQTHIEKSLGVMG